MHFRQCSYSFVSFFLLAMLGIAARQAQAEPSKAVTNSIGMKFVLIPAGTFTMGSSDFEEGDDDPPHAVQISKAFYLGQYEVTLGQFKKFVAETNYKTEIEHGKRPGFGFLADQKIIEILPEFNWRNNGLGQTDDHPVANIGYDDANAFCKWLSAKEKVAYRLPTEAEWEYACRGGTKTKYCSGNDEESLKGFANVADAAFLAKYTDATWSVEWSDGHAFTAPVGSFKPNAWGLYDMHGNVWEWCSDWYGAIEKKDGAIVDPQGPGTGERRMLRGGAFTNRGGLVSSANRNCFRPKYRYNFTGFRVVRVAE